MNSILKENKMKIFKSAGVYLVSSSELSSRTTLEVVKDFLEAGGKLFQLREKTWNKEQFLKIGKELREVSNRTGSLFILNDDPILATELKADGVHLGQDDTSVMEARRIIGNDGIIGVSTHNLEEAIKAFEEGADYINIGPVFPTGTKPGVKSISINEVDKIVKQVKLPYTFMGGIKASNLTQLLKFSPSAFAMITELTMAESVETKLKDILRVIGK